MDIEKARELHSSPFWELVIREIDEMKIQPLLNRLKSCTKDDLDRIQTEIKVWEEAKRLPQDAIEREE
jgi:hypothetical protein